MVRSSSDDVNAAVAEDDFVFPEPQLAIADAFAGSQVVFETVPGADEMHLLLGEGLAHVVVIFVDQVDDAGDHDALAGGSAGMDAIIAVAEVFAPGEEYPQLGAGFGSHD